MYLKWQETSTSDFSPTALSNLYNEGFVLTRKGKGEMDQTRSVRIDLSKFALSSENRRILKKTDGLELEVVQLPYSAYTWEIGKLGKDFYEDKFGTGTFSANKIKELLTDEVKSNFNAVLVYRYNSTVAGYCISYQNPEILHYSYPFYDRNTEINNLGLGMMLRAIMHAQASGKKYIYLGSAQRPTDIYKLQFSGLEWFDGEKWQTNNEELKNILSSEPKIKVENKKEIKISIFKRFNYFLVSYVMAFVLIYFACTVFEQIFKRSGAREGKGNPENWICNNWRNYYHCDFEEFVQEQISMWPFILIGVGGVSTPVSVIIYLVLIHRERVQKK